MFGIQIKIPTMMEDGKEGFITYIPKYLTNRQAKDAKYRLIQISKCKHLAPCDIESQDSPAKVYDPTHWKIGNIITIK